VAVPAGLGARAMALYRQRWNVESLFYVWSQDRAKPRPKTIHAHVVQSAAFILLKTHASVLLIVRGLTMRGPRPTTFWETTTIEVGRWILDDESGD
jgi:IS4 transposase